jgi:hypothetical protein
VSVLARDGKDLLACDFEFLPRRRTGRFLLLLTGPGRVGAVLVEGLPRAVPNFPSTDGDVG